MRMVLCAFTIAAMAAAGCKPAEEKEAAPAGLVAIELDRVTNGNDILVEVHVSNPDGTDAEGETPVLTVVGGTVSPVTDAGQGRYTAVVTPAVVDDVVHITATATGRNAGVTATKKALVFSTLDESLGQPEAVDGYVNTGGWEDGADISPDGQWLLVATYLPLDGLSCGLAGHDPADPACATILGPYDAPERPGMLGADRIANGTYENVCPSVGITTPSDQVAFMPGAAYGFRRQADGSFREPFVIGFEADGCMGPYGFTFAGSPSGSQADVVFANHDPLEGGDSSNADIYYAPLTLGAPNILGTYQLSGGTVELMNNVTVKIPPVTPERQGNPTLSGGRLWWDNENPVEVDRDLMFTEVSGALPTITAGSAMTVGVSLPGQEEIQPALDGNDLYFMGGGKIYRSTLATGADASLPASWSSRAALLGPASVTEQIVAVGEPSIAHVGGRTEMYFVFIVRRPNGGYDGNVGRVPFR